MSDVNNIFYQLIRVAIGTQESSSTGLRAGLSRLPSETEWEELFEMAVKQSLVGICFCGIHQLGADSDEGYVQIGMSEDLYFDWMGTAAQINMKNDLVNEQCVELQKRLAAEGFRSSILKGQAVAMLYGEELRGFRQSGDIDVLVDCNRRGAIEYAQKSGLTIGRWDYKHLDIKVFEDTEVEMHYRPGVPLNIFRNRKLQKFWKENAGEFYTNTIQLGEGSILAPSSRMQTFYIMHHTFHHLISGGIGMRQMMDLYFAFVNRDPKDDEWLKEQVATFGMATFASAAVWLFDEVFGMAMIDAPWNPNEREGRFVLNEIMVGGNFGKGDDRYKKANSHAGILGNIIRRNLHLASHYGSEALMAPLYYVWHFCWKRLNK